MGVKFNKNPCGCQWSFAEGATGATGEHRGAWQITPREIMRQDSVVAERHWTLARHASVWNTPHFKSVLKGRRKAAPLKFFSGCRSQACGLIPKSAVPSGRGTLRDWLQTLACLANIRGRSATTDQTLACLAYIRRRSVTTDQTPIGDR